MGIEWYRDLSITILGFVTTAVLVFLTVIIYLLYRKANSALQLAKSASKIAYDTVTRIQEGIKPLLPILAVIQGIRGGFKDICKIFKKESHKGEKQNE
jgi:branched-subunit amino acid permease